MGRASNGWPLTITTRTTRTPTSCSPDAAPHPIQRVAALLARVPRESVVRLSAEDTLLTNLRAIGVPTAATEFKQIATIAAAGAFLAMVVGALIGGPLADYIGRKKVILFAALFFGICSLATAFATDLRQLMVIRFITGLGLGAAMPNAIALISEYSPHRHRAIHRYREVNRRGNRGL